MSKYPSSIFTLSLLFIFIFIEPAGAQKGGPEIKIAPENALEQYINNADKTYKWELKDSLVTSSVTTYNLLLTSQKWQEFTWTHQLSVFVPADNNFDGALLFISGGSVNSGLPKWNKSGFLWPVHLKEAGQPGLPAPSISVYVP